MLLDLLLFAPLIYSFIPFVAPNFFPSFPTLAQDKRLPQRHPHSFELPSFSSFSFVSSELLLSSSQKVGFEKESFQI